jgi:hypothetical protein
MIEVRQSFDIICYMTEKDKNDQFVDRTCSSTGVENNCRWELYSLPEFSSDDTDLTLGWVNTFAEILEEEGISNATVNIIDGYDVEPEGKKHYRLSAVFSEGGSGRELALSRNYIATDEEGKRHSGQVTVRMKIDHFFEKETQKHLVEAAFGVYDEEMVRVYSGWINNWSEEESLVESD